ncbi:MAG: glycosyltransferase family 2 protein [Pseudomonadota bacterium]
MVGFLSRVTPVIIVKNGAQHMEKTLKSLHKFPRVVVFDNGSTDHGLEIASSFSNVELFQGDFIGFGPTKNLAASYAKTPWVLSLDIDEQPDGEFLKELDEWEPVSNKTVGRVHRRNFFCGKAVATNGWGGDRLIRVYNRDVLSFNSNKVHEKVEVDKDVVIKEFGGSISHDAIHDVSQLLNKAQFYSELYAESSNAKLYPFAAIVAKTLFAFIRSYVLKLGFLSGWRGFSIAFGESVGVYFKYIKIYQRHKFKGE